MSALWNSLYLRRAGHVLAPPATTGPALADTQIATACANLSRLGYVFSPDLVDALRTADPTSFAPWYHEIHQAVSEAKRLTDRPFPTPFYPRFPREVMAASDAKLYLSALRHETGNRHGERIVPRATGTLRPVLRALPDARTIQLGTSAHRDRILADLMTATQGWGATELADIDLIVAHRPDLARNAITSGIGNRENRAHLWVRAQRCGDRALAELAHTMLDSATDALRAGAAWAGFSPALPPITTVRTIAVPGHWERPATQPTSERVWVPAVVAHKDQDRIRFGPIPGRIRRALLAVIDRDPQAIVALQRRPGLWKTFGERLHPGDYAARFPAAYAAFTALRQGTARPANSALEQAMAAGDVSGVLDAVQHRPGELVRRLDALLRRAPSDGDVAALWAFLDDRAHEVSSWVLWQALAHFAARDSSPVRAVLPKGRFSTVTVLPARDAPLPPDLVAGVIDRLSSAITRIYRHRPALDGRWAIDPALDRIRVPGALRESTTGYDTVGRGSRVALASVAGQPATTVRLFCHWRDQDHPDPPRGRVDIDLSGVLYDADFTRRGAVWYGNLRVPGVTHSGDFTSAPNGAAEFLDVDLAAMRDAGVRYVAISVIAFTGQALCTVPELFAGVQMRLGDPGAGEVFDPRSVTAKFAIAAQREETVPLLVDVETREMIWLDAMVAPHTQLAGRNVDTNRESEREVILGVLAMTGPSVGQVVRANVLARGGVVVPWSPAVASGARASLAESVSDPVTVLTHGVDGLSIPMTELLGTWL